MEGKTPDQIAEAVQTAYAKGELPKMEMVAFAYMFSANQDLGPGVGHWHPHMTIADAVAWLFSDRSSYCTGQSLTLDGGLTAQRPNVTQPASDKTPERSKCSKNQN
jgi:NAD(P)-dependent dehydrogenase (short-subunit alcohol dehydrogenase family)